MNKFTIEQINEISVVAGEAIMEIYENGDFSVDFKSDDSPLTAADKAAHIAIVQRLDKLTPHISILSEEAVEEFGGANAQGEYWLVDPLDGTKEFIKRNGEFTVNIALIRDGVPVLGSVYAPATETLYYADEKGAFKKQADADEQAIQVSLHQEGQVWRVVGSRSHASQETLDYLADIGDFEMVPMGSSLKLCLVAEGKADLYPRFGLTSLWDTAAAHAVVLAAGGEVITPEGEALSYADTSKVLNPFFIVRNPHDWK